MLVLEVTSCAMGGIQLFNWMRKMNGGERIYGAEHSEASVACAVAWQKWFQCQICLIL